MIVVSQHIIDQLGSPRTAIVNNIAAELNEIQAALGGKSQGLVYNICRRMLKDSGDCITLSKEQLFDSWDHTAVPRADIQNAVDALAARNFFTSEHDFVRISSNLLGKFIHAAIEADITALSKVESMIAREFRSYQSNRRYLSQQEISQVEPVLSGLMLPASLHKFVSDSIAYRRRQRFWRILIITSVFAALIGLSVVALVQSTKAKESASVARSNEEAALRLADTLKLNETTIKKQNRELDSLFRVAEDKAASAERERGDAVVARGEAEKQLGFTLVANKEAEAQKQAAIAATVRAEREKRIADSAKIVAIKQSIEADDAKLAAILAQENAEKLRSELLSVALAEKSLSAPGEAGSDTIRAMVARVAFNIETESHDSTNHHTVHPKLYSCLYYAHKLLNRTTTYNAAKLGNQPLHAMTFVPQNNTLYMSYGADGLQSMRFDKQLSDSEFDFPDIDTINSYLRQPAHNFLLTENNSIITASGEYIHKIDLNNNAQSEYRLSNGVKILNVIPFNESDEFIVLTSTNKLYNFNSSDGIFSLLPNYAGVTHVSYIKRLNILIYTTRDDLIYLVNFNKNISVSWGARPGLSKFAIQDYGDKIFIVFGYLNGGVRVGVTDATELTAHDDKLTRSMRMSRMLETILSSNVHTGFITDIDFATNSHQMVLASGDGTASIWDLQSWAQRRTDYQPILLDDHEGWVTSCGINSDENVVFTGTKSGVVKFWPLDPAFYADEICKKLSGRSFNPREWNIYVGNEVPFEKQICE